MRPYGRTSVFLILFLSLTVSLLAMAQANPDASTQAERQKAEALFAQDKRLEALPLLEDLLKKNPRDDELLVELAAALVDHALILSDPDAAGRERFRARDLVQQAWELGNTSPLAENLRQLLGELPANGAIKFSDNPAVDKIMLEGETAFSRRDFDQALKAYGKALKLEPTNYSATLFIANSYDRENHVDRAAEWYQKAIKLNPNIETAYRYYADMLAREGDMAKARTMLILAAVAEPYNKIVWREIRAWAIINNTAFKIVYVPIPQKDRPTSSAHRSQDLSAAWQAYYSVRTDWQKGRFEKQFPQETEYRHSLPEESEALTAAAKVLEKFKNDDNGGNLMVGNPVAGLLLELYEAGLIDPYVLFNLGDDGIAKDYIGYRAKNRVKLEDYMDKFVVPPAPAR